MEKAMNEASGLAGWELKNIFSGNESKLIQIIVDKIFRKLCSINLSLDGDLVGMEIRKKEVLSSLDIGTNDVRMIGIKGIGGGGKTTLAGAVYDQISTHFDGKSFVENVREVSKTSLSGLKTLQEQILRDVFDDRNISISGVSEGKKMMRKVMFRKKVLVVLDDVDHRKQLEALVDNFDNFKPGSRIIITTRDEQVLLSHGVRLICNVKLLTDKEAVCLFSRHAFGKEIPNQGFNEMSGQAVQYAAGLPLTIRVLGSSLRGKSKLEWEDALKRLKKVPEHETQEILKISYDALESDYKEIFLDVACILKGEQKDKAIRVLESCGFYGTIGLSVLEQKCLINISQSGSLGMHDLIEEMGKHIVRRSDPNEPKSDSRLWITEKSDQNILDNHLVNERIRCIKLSRLDIEFDTVMRAIRNKRNLRVLYMCSGANWKDNKDVGQRFPDSLQYLSWRSYPFKSLHETFQADNLVGLDMSFSSIEVIWEWGTKKILNKLRFLDLSYSNLKMLNLKVTPKLEILNLEHCANKELYIAHGCPKLQYLNLEFSKLGELILGPTPDLETLSLGGCSNLLQLHLHQCPKLKVLKLDGSKLWTLDLGLTPNLERLDLKDCSNLEKIDAPDGCLEKLVYLDLSGCGRFKSFLFDKQSKPLKVGSLSELHLIGESIDICPLHPDNSFPKFQFKCFYKEDPAASSIGNLEKLISIGLCSCTNLESFSRSIYSLQCLEKLTLEGSIPEVYKDSQQLLEGFPVGIFELKSLEYFHFLNCTPDDLPEELGHLNPIRRGITLNFKMLKLEGCNNLVDLHLQAESLNLEYLGFSHSKLKTLKLGNTPNLKVLVLKGCNHLVKFQMPDESLNLQHLDLSDSKLKTVQIGNTPNLEELILKGCNHLVEFQMPDESLNLQHLDLSDSKLKTVQLGNTPNLQELILKGCNDLVELQMPSECLNLKFLDLSDSKLKTLDLGPTPNLERLYLTYCSNLEKIDAPDGCLKKLVCLTLTGCVRFKYFWFDKHPPFNHRKKHLDSKSELHLIAETIDVCLLHPDNSSPKFRFECYYDEAPTSSFGNLEMLISMGLCACTNLEKFSRSICCLRGLRKLTLEGSIPEVTRDLDQLECLEELIFSSSNIRNLPDSICKLKHLKSLELESCLLLEKLPDDLGRIESLETLTITDCSRLRDVPNNIGKINVLYHQTSTGATLMGNLSSSQNDAVDRPGGLPMASSSHFWSL